VINSYCDMHHFFEQTAKTDSTDKFVLVANRSRGSSALSIGAKVYISIISGANACCGVVKSRNGRWIRMWMSLNTLKNFRAICVPDGHPLRRVDRNVLLFDLKVDAEKLIPQI